MSGCRLEGGRQQAHAGCVYRYTEAAEAPAPPFVRDAPTVLGDLGFEALLPLLRARTVDDVDAALDAWVEPAPSKPYAEPKRCLTSSVR